MKFLVMDTRFAYHGVLGRPILKDLQVVTSIHHLAIKFLTPGELAKVQDNQTKVRLCYMNVLQKAIMHEGIFSVVMTIRTEAMDIDQEKGEEDMVLDKCLNPQIIGLDSLASSTEELEMFLVRPLNFSQMIQLGQKLEERMKEILKWF
ncbi:Uncharacterized protein Adt_21270 [Abeliophyllum distichum]|uniref:Uncharacterized protein n=1 Tax=Abeliophyllum distichum TaxID=126358 RepID=A0ABD1SYY5_9LAMI